MTETDVADRLRAAGCVFAEDEGRLLTEAARSTAELDALVEQRAAGVPLEHVLGWAEFCGLRVQVDPGVFVPRKRTEFLVREAAARARRPRASVIDMCCGSGAVGLALAVRLGSVQLHAVDIDPAAAACARRNLIAVGGHVYQSDLFESLPTRLRGSVDIITANVPYIPTRDIALLPPEAREHEPRHALDGGPDGLDVLRRVAAAARHWLGPGGSLLCEVSERQADVAAVAFADAALVTRLVRDTEFDGAVIVGAVPG